VETSFVLWQLSHVFGLTVAGRDTIGSSEYMLSFAQQDVLVPQNMTTSF
jgi:hypothetical protein